MKLNKIIIAMALLILLILLILNIRILFINNNAYQAEKSLAFNNFPSAFNYFEKTLKANDPTLSPYTRYRYGQVILSYALSGKYFKQKIDKEILTRGIKLQIKNSRNQWPYFTRNYLLAGQLSNYLGEYKQAEKYFNKALDLSPNRPEIFLELAKTYMLAKNYKKAEGQVKKALSYDPDNPKTNWQFLLLQIRQNKDTNKIKNKLIKSRYHMLNFKSFNELAWAYEDAENSSKAQSYYNVIDKLWLKSHPAPATF